MAAEAQAGTLPAGVKPLVPDAHKGSMDGKTILSFMYKYESYFSLVSMSNRYLQALFTVRMLQRPVYT